MDAREWLGAFAAEIGGEVPSEEEIESILALAGTAAHSSERIAAPVACWVGARSGSSLAELRAAAERIGDAG